MYTARDVTNVLGLPSTRLRSYLRAGLVKPERHENGALVFSFQDLVVLRKVEGLVDKSVSPQRAGSALRRVQATVGDRLPLSGLDFDTDGEDVVVAEGPARWRADSGQVLFDFRRPRFGGTNLATHDGAAAIAPLDLARDTRKRRNRTVESLATAQECFERGCAAEETDPAEARDCYRRAIDLDPNHADAHVNLGRLMHEGGHPDAAQIHYRVALSVRPEDPTATFNLGVALEDTGQRDDAIRSYQASITSDPGNADAHYNLARLLEQTGRPDAAIRHLMIYRQLTRAGR